MKSKLISLVIMALVALSLMVPGSVVAADTTSQSEVVLAQQSAQNWLDGIASSRPDIAKWQSATVTSPQVFHDVKDNVVGYLFTISAKDEAAGFIMVGNASYEYNVFEASDGRPLSTPSASDVKYAVSKLGIVVTDEKNINPVNYIYGGTSSFYAVYDLDGKKVAYNLLLKKVIMASDIQSNLLPPDRYLEVRTNLR